MVFSRAQVDDYNPLKRSVATRDVKRDQIVQLPYGRQTLPYRLGKSRSLLGRNDYGHRLGQFCRSAQCRAATETRKAIRPC